MDMDLDRALTDTEVAGNLFIGQAGCGEPCYLILTVGELHDVTRCPLERTIHIVAIPAFGLTITSQNLLFAATLAGSPSLIEARRVGRRGN